MNDVIVIGSNYSTTLGTVRSIGMAGFGVRLLSKNQECAKIISNSRYIINTVICEENIESIFEGLEKLRGEDAFIPVIPTSDYLVMILDMHADMLRDHYCFPHINETQGEISGWMDKMRQKRLAESLGLSVAKGKAYPADNDGIKMALKETVFPCVTKAIFSEDCVGSKDLFRICSGSSDLEEIMNTACRKHCSSVIVEQLLDIEKEYAAYGLAYHGKVVMPACVDTWRSGHGAHTGVTAEGIMLKADFLGEDKQRFENIVKKIGLNGLFCFDIIYSKGKYYFVELNLRYGASGYAATVGGANLPGLFAQLMLNGGELDETVHLNCEPQFLSEKVELDDYRVGYMSWREYKEHQKGTKVFFIKSEDDPGPWRSFKKYEMRKILARLLKGKKRRH